MKILTKRLVLLATAVAAVSGVSSSVIALSSAEPMYAKTYYSDATLSTQVGFRMDGCNNGRVSAGPLIGTSTPYFIEEYVGACRPGGMGGYD